MNKIVVLGNSAGWCGRSWEDLKKRSGCKVINKHFPCSNDILERFIRIHFSDRINKYFSIPLKSIWFKYFRKNLIENKNEKIVLIVYDGNKLGNNADFLSYLKRECKNIKLVYIITNEVRYSMASRNAFYDKLGRYYDIIYGFHLPDEKKYGIPIIPLVYSKNRISHNPPVKNMFFAGEAKTRLKHILRIYDRLREFGFGGRIIALHYNEKDLEMVTKDVKDVISNVPISYDDVIKYTQESAVIVEIPQDELEAITIKTCEAIYYDKLLITTNKLLKTMPFYDPRFMLCIEKADEIPNDFLDRWENVKYNKEAIDYFSVDTFLNRLSKDLNCEIVLNL